MTETLRRIVDSTRFQRFITLVILFTAVLVGVETYPSIVSRYGTVLHALDQLVLGIFTLEIVLKIGAQGQRPWRYFLDPWNVFDFLIVALAFLPVGAQYVTVLRLLRLLRVLRLVRALPRLQMLVGALLKSIPSMGYVSLLLLLIFYVYAVAGVFLFGQNDPFRFGSLQIAFVTLFQVATAEDWSTTLYTQMYSCAAAGYEGREALCVAPMASPVVAPFYFISFILVGTMVILNLFIGVIMKGMEESQQETAELEARRRLLDRSVGETRDTLERDLQEIHRQLGDLRNSIQALGTLALVLTEKTEAATSDRPRD